MLIQWSIAFFTLLHVIVAGPSPPSGALEVGTAAQYKTVQSAVNAAKPGQTIFIHPGTYNEQVWVKLANITIIGSSSSPNSYSSNKVTITDNKSQDKGLNNDQTGTLRAHGDNFKLYNVNLVNSRGKGSQAIALSAYGDKQGYYGVQFRGFQDTVLSEKGHHFFSQSLIEGATDFIFGQHAQSWFEKCDIRVTAPGWITANGRDSETNPSYYVLNRCNIEGTSGAGSGKTYLGRPWRKYARVVFQNCKLGSVIHPAGWSIWNKGNENTQNVYFAEHGNTGPGAAGARASFSRKISSPVSVDSVLPGMKSWADMKFMGG